MHWVVALNNNEGNERNFLNEFVLSSGAFCVSSDEIKIDFSRPKHPATSCREKDFQVFIKNGGKMRNF